MSQPSWAAWIEISFEIALCSPPVGRSPLGLRGLKCLLLQTLPALLRRSPLGLRGLK